MSQWFCKFGEQCEPLFLEQKSYKKNYINIIYRGLVRTKSMDFFHFETYAIWNSFCPCFNEKNK